MTSDVQKKKMEGSRQMKSNKTFPPILKHMEILVTWSDKKKKKNECSLKKDGELWGQKVLAFWWSIALTECVPDGGGEQTRKLASSLFLFVSARRKKKGRNEDEEDVNSWTQPLLVCVDVSSLVVVPVRPVNNLLRY